MNEDEKKGSGSALKIILTVLIVLILGGLAVFGYIYWDSQKEAAQQALQAQRKAHADSVMQVRAQIEAQEAEAQRQDEKRKGICRFLESFYKKAVLTDDADADFDYEQLQRNLKVVAVDDNWYKVRLSQDGETEYRQVKVLSQDGHTLIDDVR